MQTRHSKRSFPGNVFMGFAITRFFSGGNRLGQDIRFSTIADRDSGHDVVLLNRSIENFICLLAAESGHGMSMQTKLASLEG